jgi:hypothetical protein
VPRGVAKFQAVDEKSFFVHRTPLVMGRENAEVWSQKRNSAFTGGGVTQAEAEEHPVDL